MRNACPSMRRRGLLRLTALLPVLVLPACQPAGSTPSQLTVDVGLLASGLAAVAATVAQMSGVPAPALAQLQGCVAKLQTVAAQLSIAGGKPSPAMIQNIGATVRIAASMALPLVPDGSAAAMAIQAALSLLPPLLAASGVAGDDTAQRFTPDQARRILAATR